MDLGVPRPGSHLGGFITDPRVEPWELDLESGLRTMLRSRPTGQARGVALLIPGFTGSREDFRLLLPAMADLGWDAWTYSQRGQADSAHTPGYYTRDDFAADAVAVARAVQAFSGADKVHLLGHSFGGVVATAAAIAAPELFADVVLFCSGPHGWQGRTTPFVEAMDAHPGVDNWTLQRQGDVPARLNADESFHLLRAQLTDNDSLRAILSILEADTDYTEQLRATGLPTAVIHGDADDAWPIPMQADWAARLGAQYVVIPGAGHLPNIDQPEVTAQECDAFWSARS